MIWIPRWNRYITEMGTYSPSKESSILSSPYSSPNLSALLKIKIISWSQETGLPITARVRVAEKSFNLHKFPLMAKSGYFKKHLKEWQEVELPTNFPGGSETFEMIALFIYNSSTFIDPFNVASLRCASEFLEMTEVYLTGNLSTRTDLYLNQVVLQSWDDTLIVLQKCQSLLPWAEDLLIVSRCIESLAFMACMEILDPERKRERPIASLEALSSRPWSCEIVSQDLWIKDLIGLNFGIFKRVVCSLRRQGMKEKFVSPIIVFYANKWVLSKKTRRFWECLSDKEDDTDSDETNKVAEVFRGILDLLLVGEKGCRVIPVGFYLTLLARSLELKGLNDERIRLQGWIVPILPLANVEDFLLPKKPNESISSSVELDIMRDIFSMYFQSFMVIQTPPPMGNMIVAELWDLYLVQVARDSSLTAGKFMELVEVVPLSYRNSHDHLYRAMNAYVLAHPNLSQDEKGAVCKYLICHKLSQVCIEAVQNEFMPLRLIVQALFVQQLNTQQAFRDCSESFRFTYSGELSATISTSKIENSKTNLESPFTDGSDTNPLNCLLLEKDDLGNIQRSRNEYESTSFRIQNLEQELSSLKKSLRLQKSVKETGDLSGLSWKTRSCSKRRDAFGEVTGCIGSVNFSSQRKYAGKLLKIIRRVSLFGRGKLKRRPTVSGS